MSTIIRTRSPFFIRTADVTDATLSYFSLILTVYNGNINEVPTCGGVAEITTLEKRVLPTETSVTFEISEIINQYLVQTFTGSHSADLQSLWATTAVTARKEDGTAIGATTNTTFLAQEGFNFFKDGVNFTAEAEAMITTNHIQVKKGDAIKLPVNKERVNSVAFKSGSSTISTQTISDDGHSNQKIFYCTGANNSIDNIVVTYDTSSTRTITVEQIEECKYSPFKCVFLNRWGAFQDLYFFKKSTSSLESTNESFNKSIFIPNKVTKALNISDECVSSSTYNTYSTTDHAVKTYNTNAKESIVLNTGFIRDDMNTSFQELLVSEYVWLVDSSGTVLPSTLKDSSFTTKTGLNDKMINYTMEFEMSFDYINNVR
tara:strand:- start:4165 stop:5286 length:1122 start_codon:yes stop_codon:yes gene_type:complete